jgi:hypothetical protein
MKYYYNGQWRDVYAKTADTLPVGSVIDYNGATVPSGWERIADDFAVVTGTMTIAANVGDTDTPAYPTGFTADNCVPISFGVHRTSLSVTGYNYYGFYANSSDLLRSGYRRCINLDANNLSVYIENPASSEITVEYKVVLMKIN